MPLPFADERGAETSDNDDDGQRASGREAMGGEAARSRGWAGRAPSVRRLAASPAAVAGLLGLAAFVVYLRTLAVSIVWGDSPELTAAAFNAGIPHPTGYPLYMLLAHAFMRLVPVGSIAYRMNLLAALSAGIAVALIYRLLLRVSGARWASVVTALAFAYSRTFWSQSVIAEHYPFAILCIAAVLGCVLAWDRRGERCWLFTSAVVYGFCLTHHMMSLLLAPGLLYFALTSRHRSQFLRELPRTVPL
ncbi:MAG: glycosyltransferase family 117 protein, partial [Dehalococcoidia bacterium]